MIGSSTQRVWFFFFARIVVSFCRNNYHGSASQQRENIARSHCIHHVPSSSFRASCISQWQFDGRKRQPKAPGKAEPLTKQAVRPPEAGQRGHCPLLALPASDHSGVTAELELLVTAKFTVSPATDVMMHKDTNLALDLLTLPVNGKDI